jgi:hypothetical protein
MAFGGAVGFPVVRLASMTGADEDKLAGYLLLPLIGIGVGIAQWLVLNQRVAGTSGWIIASVVGYAACSTILALLNAFRVVPGSWWPQVLLLFTFGAAVGLCQWLVLRRRYSRARWWILANAIGLLGLLVLFVHPASSQAQLIGCLAGAGAFSGVVTGWLLAMLRR